MGYKSFRSPILEGYIGFKLGNYNYWVFTEKDNAISFAVAAYDDEGNLIETWERPGSRYISQIEIIKETESIRFIDRDGPHTEVHWEEFLIR
ncbi:hypothetical protein DH09_10075 [Bacillaceae bacterium JMAK1]|nr:hypothetical protein DH09_10075 [Bacillaceae bacterium JMAK1]